MNDPERSSKLVPVLWFVAAALSVIAFAIRYAKGGGPQWSLAAAAAFTATMGLVALKRRTQ